MESRMLVIFLVVIPFIQSRQISDPITYDCTDVDGGWTEWSNYSPCSVSCGKGLQKRYRYCAAPVAKYGGQYCEGHDVEITECDALLECPVDGGWSDYVKGDCSVTCGGGNVVYTRTCNNPIPQYGGKDCVGNATYVEDCNTQDCPVDGGWSDYVKGDCSVTCGGGNVVYTRTCNNPTPQYGGKDCEGNTIYVEDCNMHYCPVDGGWSDYVIGECSVTCGGGTVTYTRTCNNPTPQYGGKDCEGEATYVEHCNTQDCPVDGGWSDYVKGDCSVTCGGGTVTFTRTCNNPTPQYGGKDCVGDVTYVEHCNTHDCPIWSEWNCTACYKKPVNRCIQKCTRTCIYFKNDKDYCDGHNTEYRDCDHDICYLIN